VFVFLVNILTVLHSYIEACSCISSPDLNVLPK